MTRYMGLKGHALALVIGIIAGLDFFLFGYDQGVTGGLLEMSSFKSHFPSIDPTQYICPEVPHEEKFTACLAGNRTLYQVASNFQAIAVSSYNLGCFFGAIVCIWLGDRLGRRWTIFTGSLIMIVGAALQASAFHVAQLILGRVITGFGNGLNTSTVPTWQSETSKSHHRGAMVMLEGALVVAGIAFSYWVDFGFQFMGSQEMSWRFPLALQAAVAIAICVSVLALPESPRWLVMKGRRHDARRVLSALRNRRQLHEEVSTELVEICDAVTEAEQDTFRSLFTMQKESRHLHRTVLAYVSQMFQQVSGINLITYYLPIILSKLGLKGYMPSLLAACNGTEYFIASLIPLFLIEKVGRRPLLLVGAAGMSVSMLALTVSSWLFETKGSMAAGYTSVAFTFFFNTFFGTGWLGLTWLYPAEVVPTQIRGPANALSTSANWLFNFLVVMVAPVAFASIGPFTYLIFAVVNALIFPTVFVLFPETKGRQLEEMDTIFAKSGWLTVVKTSKTEPLKSRGSTSDSTGDKEDKGGATGNEAAVEVELQNVTPVADAEQGRVERVEY